MTGTAFVLRGLWFFRASYLAVLAGAALGAMVLLGALLAGDSVKATLRQVAAARLGQVDSVLSGGGRFFRAALADDLTDKAAVAAAAPVLWVKATVSVQGATGAVGAVQVLGVDRRFWLLGPEGAAVVRDGAVAPQERGFFINETLARSLELGPGAALVLRMEKPALMAPEVPLSGPVAAGVVLRGAVHEVCGDARFGRFSLESTQVPQATVMVPIERLQQALGLAGQANLLLLRQGAGSTSDSLLERITRHCTLADYGLTVEEVPLAGALEIRSARIFQDRQVAEVLRRRFPAAQPVITYLANTLAANGRQTPYSMVTAVDGAAAPFLRDLPNGAVLNAWAAEDLAAKPGDELRLDYYALGPGNRLEERSVRLPVAGIVPLTGLAADPAWMPDFPGVAGAEKTADWDAGVPLDLKRIRDKDEAYWDAHRGTPKVFVSLATGREWFGNRWGEFTALRVPGAAAGRGEVAAGVLAAMSPAVAGLVLRDVGAQGRAAAASSVDFAGLLLGMSLFLIAAAVALTALLFRFHIEQRNRESGLLAVLGIPASRVLRWRLLEGLCVVAAGTGIGALLAAGYTRLLLEWMEPVWGAAGGQRLFRLHAEPATLSAGMAGFVGLMMGVIWLVTRRQARQGAGLRLEAGSEEVRRTAVPPLPWWAFGFALLGGGALAATGLLGIPGAFFLAGCAGLLGGLALYRWVLRGRAAAAPGALTPERFARLNCARRTTRSLVVTGCLACGVFLVVAVAVFRKHGGDEWRQRGSGAGGFAWWVETTRAADPGQARGAAPDALDLGAARSQFGRVLPLRIGPGDDASCFNLNQVARPRLLAADAACLARLGAFSIKRVLAGCGKDWNTLGEGEVMRAFVDETTLLWVLKRQLGDRLVYQDEWGREFPVEIAGTLDDSVFQGSLVVDEARFLERYPSAEAPRLFLLESAEDPGAGKQVLHQALADQGVRVTSTRERLAAFHEVENSYIAIFQVLGGLGVIVGSAGLGLVTLRNLDERRHEFTLLHTLGVPGAVTRRVVMLEAGQFIRWGLGIGLLAALVSILPSLAGAGGVRALGWLGLWVAGIAAHAWLWSWLAWRWRTGAGRSC